MSRSLLLNDPINILIVKELTNRPRMAMSELARAVGMSAPAVRERLQRLEEGKVISGWRVEIDPAALGFGVAVMIRVRPMPGQLPRIIDFARNTPRIVECLRITGEDCFIMRAHLASLEDLDGLLDMFLIYGQTTTSIIQSAPVPRRDLPL